jgi:hypothetical protein
MKTPRDDKPLAPEMDDIDDIDARTEISRLHVRDKPDVLFAPAPSIVENVFFTNVGHTFGPLSPVIPGTPQRYIVQDFLLDQTGTSGADGKMDNLKSFDLTTSTAYRFNVFPRDRSKRIKVAPPEGRAYFGFNIGRKFFNAVSDVFDIYGAISFFSFASGNNPIFTYNNFFIGRNTNHWVHFVVDAEVTAFEFFGFTSIGMYPPRSFDPGTKSYQPFSTALPFNLPGSNGVPFLVFSYVTEKTRDPGPFVSIG